MATITPPTIAALPAAPDPNNRTTFNTLAYPWSAALPTFSAEVSALGANVYANADEAVTSSITATTQAGDAATSATTATTQAGIATTQASASSASASASEASRIAASKLNLGNKEVAPTLDNQGAALLAGATYYDTTLNKWRVWNGSAWVEGISTVAGVTSVNGLTGVVTGLGDVTLAGVQNLTNKTITDTVFALTGTTPAFTATNGAVQTWTLSGASTPTNALTTGQSIILVITPGAFTITWPSVVFTKQGGSGAAPALFSAGKTSVVLWMVGSTLYGSHLGDTV